MDTRRKLFPLVLVTMVILSAGCNLPVAPSPTPLIFPSATQGSMAASDTPEAASPTSLPAVTEDSSATPEVLLPSATATATDTRVPENTSTFTPIPTNTATFTPAPTSTKTPIPRPSSAAAFLKTPPSINGVWDEWTTVQYPIKNIVYRTSGWAAAKTLEASYRVGWDAKYLYLAVKVHDSEYVQNASGADLYKGDSIELLFSTDPDADRPDLGLTASDYQIGISPGRPNIGENLEAYLWYPKAKAGHQTKIAIGAAPMKGGYRIEFAVPWTVLGVTPAKGQVYGFAVSVSDNNDPKNNVQQGMISSVPRRSLVDPTSWGLIVLK